MRLLIVDDDAINRKLLRVQLQAEGHAVLDAADGVEALEVMERESVDGVISDILMPGMDGFRLCLEIRRRVALAQLPVVFYTSTYKSPEDRNLARAVGADHYLTKPAPVPDILRALEEAAQRERAPTVAATALNESSVLRQYNEALVRKLEERNLELEQLLERLQAADRGVRESEAALRRAQALARIGHFVWQAADGSVSGASEMLGRILGAAPGSLPGSPAQWLARVHPEDRQRVRMAYAHMRRRGGVREIDYRIVRPDGSLVVLQQTAEPATNGAGAAARWFVTVQDVTEQRDRERRLARLARMHAMLSGINNTIVRVTGQDELFSETCRLAVETGGFPLVFIRMVDADRRSLQTVASFGPPGIPTRPIDLAPRARVDGPGSTVYRAFHERRSQMRDDFATEPQSTPLTRALLAHGMRSLACFPFAASGEVIGVITVAAREAGFFDATERRLLEELAGDVGFAIETIRNRDRLVHLALHDALTGLPNRDCFHEQIDACIETAGPKSAPFAVALANLSRFRSINDTFGHHVGDEMLRRAGERLEAAAGKGQVARLGADFFGVLLTQAANATDAGLAVARLEQALGVPFEVAGRSVHIGSRFGVALYPADGKSGKELSANAEAALHKGRAANEAITFYVPEINAQVADRLDLESRLRRALAQRQFVLHFQPRVDLASGDIVGLEALIRWQDPGEGLIAPARFVPVLEESGLIVEVGLWVIEEAARTRQRILAGGVSCPRIAVNVSPVQMRRAAFAEEVIEAAFGVTGAGGGIDLEITESLLMEDIGAAVPKLERLRAAGCAIAVDDFGTGYSSLGYLCRLPVDALKIDRLFVTTMTDSADNMAIVSTIIHLAHTFKLKVTAEGVDSAEQVKLLRLLRCDEAQGYHFHRPLPEARLPGLLGGAERTS